MQKSEGPAGVAWGLVRKVFPAKCICFVRGINWGSELDLVIFGEQLDLDRLAPNDVVSCRAVWQETGQPKGLAPVWVLADFRGEEGPPVFGQVVGTVQDIESTGEGIIVCQPLMDRYKTNIVNVPAETVTKRGLSVGDTVAFTFVAGPDGSGLKAEPHIWYRSSSSLWKQDGGGSGGARPLERPSRVLRSVEGSAGDEPPNKVQAGAPSATPQAAFDEDIFFGTIVASDPDSNFVSIDCPDSGQDEPIQLLKSEVNASELELDDALAFRLRLDAQGAPTIEVPVWKLAAYPRSPDQIQFGPFFGPIRFINPSGHGCVDCEELKDQHGHEAIIKKEDLTKYGLVVGDLIAFSSIEGSEDTCWVVAPFWYCISGGAVLRPKESPAKRNLPPVPPKPTPRQASVAIDPQIPAPMQPQQQQQQQLQLQRFQQQQLQLQQLQQQQRLQQFQRAAAQYGLPLMSGSLPGRNALPTFPGMPGTGAQAPPWQQSRPKAATMPPPPPPSKTQR